MDTSAIATLVRFSFWGTDRILAACEHIAADGFTREVAPDPGWGSLRDLLVHALDAEYGWRCILRSQDADDILDATDFADVAALKARWDIERLAWQEYVAGLSVERLGEGYGADPRSGPKVWQTIMHVVTHGVQHGSEAAAILTGYGRSPGDLDFDVFLEAQPEQSPRKPFA